ncbi:MAG TPA: tetratricopeptide repeat protein [Candidatus Limnocylindria bacterium]|nr:tetratricopeptide repeat protein [Candidatus Limnocylindria bacterium]
MTTDLSTRRESSKRRPSLNYLWLAARSVLCICVLLIVSDQLRAQNPAIDEKFRQATEAMKEGRLDDADTGFTAVVREAPNFAEAYFNLGLVREEQGRHEEAIASFQKALALKSRVHGANLFLGVAEFRLNQLDKAVVALQKETAAYPKDPVAWMWLGVVRLAQEKPEEAATALDRATELAPDDMDILYHRGRAHLLVSNNSYARIFKVDPHSWRVHRVIAQADAGADRHVDAIVEFQAAIKLAPTQPGLHEELGSEYRNLGKIQEAEEAFLRELEIDPNNALALYKLGVLTVEKGDGAKGKELIEAALLEKPGLLHVDYNLGRAEMLLGNDAAAAQDLERATTAAGSTPDVVEQTWYQLGIVYRRLHRMEDAQKAMATFQKLKDEDAESSQKALKRYQVQQNPNSSQPTPNPQNPQ